MPDCTEEQQELKDACAALDLACGVLDEAEANYMQASAALAQAQFNKILAENRKSAAELALEECEAQK